MYGMGGQTRFGQNKQQSMFFCYLLSSDEVLSYFLWLLVNKSPSYCSVSYCSAKHILEQYETLLPEGDLLTTNQGKKQFRR